MNEAEEVLRLFSYTEEEQKAFPYLREYMRRVRPELASVLAAPRGRERFMLAGLFLTYRALNHSGDGISTDTSGMSPDSIHARRLEAFRRITGREISDPLKYLRMIRFNPLKLVLFGPARMLYRFVTRG